MYVERNIINPSILHQDEQELGFLFFHKRDAYDKLNHGQIYSFLENSLKQAVEDVLMGNADTVDNALKPLIEKLVTRRSYSEWKRDHYIKKYFIPKLNNASAEVFKAKKIISESKTDPAKAASDIADAKFSYVQKSMVKSMMNTTNVAKYGASTVAQQSSMGSGIIDWVRNNKTMALGLSAVTLIGFLYMRNQEQN